MREREGGREREGERENSKKRDYNTVTHTHTHAHTHTNTKTHTQYDFRFLSLISLTYRCSQRCVHHTWMEQELACRVFLLVLSLLTC